MRCLGFQATSGALACGRVESAVRANASFRPFARGALPAWRRIVRFVEIAIVVATGLAALLAGVVIGEVLFQVSSWLDLRSTRKRDRHWPSRVDRRPPL